MVRETRHLWVGNLPENIREERIIDHFKRCVKLNHLIFQRNHLQLWVFISAKFVYLSIALQQLNGPSLLCLIYQKEREQS